MPGPACSTRPAASRPGRPWTFRCATRPRSTKQSGVPLLQKYLPFGIAVLVGQLLYAALPIIGLLYPALRVAPGLYDWAMRQRIFRLYGELKLLEHELDGDPGTERKADLRTRLDALERRVGRMHISNAYAQVIYALRLHINLVRSRL